MIHATDRRSAPRHGPPVPKKPDKPVTVVPISVEIGGTTYAGRREVLGVRRLDQVVHFGELRDTDFRGYSPKECRAMEEAARRLLVGLVQEAARRQLEIRAD